MLGIEVRPVWKRKNKVTESEDPTEQTTIVDTVAIAEEAIERLAIKVILGAVVVTGTTILLSTLGRIAESAFDHHVNK